MAMAIRIYLFIFTVWKRNGFPYRFLFFEEIITETITILTIMKRTLIFTSALFLAISASGQPAGGFGGWQMPEIKMEYSQKYSDVNYAGDGEVFHNMDIYLPKEEKPSYPVVVHIYGSAWYSNNSKSMADLGTIVQALLDAGYAVVTPNHRSSMDAKFPAQINDIKAVIRFVRANAAKFKFDTSFIATSGFSSGGHLSSLAAVSADVKELEGNVGEFSGFSSHVNAACDWSGPIDMFRMNCDEPRKWGGTPEEALVGFDYAPEHEALFKSISPMTYLDPKDSPIVIFHGQKDDVVPFCQGVELYEGLDKLKVKTELHLVPEGGHGFNMYSEENLKAMVAFLDGVRAASSRPQAGAVRQAEIIPGRTPVSPTLEDYFIPSVGDGISPDKDGFITRWLLLEPIPKPNGSNTVFTDSYVRENLTAAYNPILQKKLPKDGDKVCVTVDVTPAAPAFVMPGMEAPKIEKKIENRTLAWHALDSKRFNVKLFRFAAGLKLDVYGVIFWGCTVIDCPQEINNVRLSAGTNGASMWWLNGEEVLLMQSDRRMVQDDCMSSRLTLKKGRNVIWFSVINGPGMSDMCVRFVDEQGKPVTNFKVNTK